MNPNRRMHEETGLFVGDKVGFRGAVWTVKSATFFPKTYRLHCISLFRGDNEGTWSAAAHANEFNELELLPTPIEGEET